jgi:hypothetical protein
MCPMLAMADESISGQWQADLGHGVLIGNCLYGAFCVKGLSSMPSFFLLEA